MSRLPYAAWKGIGKTPKGGWRPLPGAQRNNEVYLRRLNKLLPLWPLITAVILALVGLVALIYFVVGG